MWQPVNTAPKDGTKIDILAKCWMSENDRFVYRRFTDCFWTYGDSMTGRNARWIGVDVSYCPTHWMPLPDMPNE